MSTGGDVRLRASSIGRVDDLRPARAREPDIPVVPAAIQLPAPLVLAYKGHQSGEGFWHGAGRLSQR